MPNGISKETKKYFKASCLHYTDVTIENVTGTMETKEELKKKMQILPVFWGFIGYKLWVQKERSPNGMNIRVSHMI